VDWLVLHQEIFTWANGKRKLATSPVNASHSVRKQPSPGRLPFLPVRGSSTQYLWLRRIVAAWRRAKIEKLSLPK
jgi:hypothetical protein